MSGDELADLIRKRFWTCHRVHDEGHPNPIPVADCSDCATVIAAEEALVELVRRASVPGESEELQGDFVKLDGTRSDRYTMSADHVAVIQAVITDWARDNREWKINVGDAEDALKALVAERDEARRARDAALERGTYWRDSREVTGEALVRAEAQVEAIRAERDKARDDAEQRGLWYRNEDLKSKELTAERDALREALKKYADDGNWEDVSLPESVNTAGYMSFEWCGPGEIPWEAARGALGGKA